MSRRARLLADHPRVDSDAADLSREAERIADPDGGSGQYDIPSAVSLIKYGNHLTFHMSRHPELLGSTIEVLESMVESLLDGQSETLISLSIDPVINTLRLAAPRMPVEVIGALTSIGSGDAQREQLEVVNPELPRWLSRLDRESGERLAGMAWVESVLVAWRSGIDQYPRRDEALRNVEALEPALGRELAMRNALQTARVPYRVDRKLGLKGNLHLAVVYLVAESPDDFSFAQTSVEMLDGILARGLSEIDRIQFHSAQIKCEWLTVIVDFVTRYPDELSKAKLATAIVRFEEGDENAARAATKCGPTTSDLRQLGLRYIEKVRRLSGGVR
jgi:hypothetical protein